MDLVTLLIGAAFYVLFAASIRRWLQHRGPLELAVVLVFSSTAALFAIGVINGLLPSIAPVLSPLPVVLLVAQPALMVRLVSLIVPLPRWAVPTAIVGFVLAVGSYYATNKSVPSILFLVGYFTVTEILAAIVLLAEGRRRQGLPRVRLTIAGAASILFGLSILVSGLAAAARGGAGPSDPAIQAASRFLALVAGLGYLAAFVPPRWLRELGQRALAFDLVRSIVSTPTGTEPRVLWTALATAASDILGTSRVRISDGDVVLAEGDRDPPARATEPVTIDLVSEDRHVATLTADLIGRPLFLEDDIALIELLGSLTARAVEREKAVATLTDAARALDEAGAVRVSEARFRALLDAEPNAILSVDGTGTIRWATRSAVELFGLAETSLVGQRLDDVVLPGNEARAPGRTSRGVDRYETVGRRADGTTFPAEIALSSFEFDGAPSQLAVITDITWRHDADELRDRFIGVLSHELRTPITSIFGGTQVLLERGDQLDPVTRDELLSDVAGESERLQRMIENLLILARVERGADVVDVVPVLVHRVLPDVVARERANWPSMTLTTSIQPGLPLIAADEASLALVLRNLISNAGKYAGDEAVVSLSAEADPAGGIAVRVRDDGPGIEPDEADALFGLYFRSAASAPAPGSGIGLFVCRHLVAAMGGETWARLRPEGGAEFGFTLPAWTEVDDEAEASSRPTDIGRIDEPRSLAS
jgi:PAS domain S-box-containing protein